MALPESLVNGRFQILERPATLPGKCAVCGAVDKPVVDFGLTIEFYGAVVICVEDCLREALSLTNLTNAPAQVASLNFDAEAVNEYLRTTNDATRRLLTVLPDSYFLFDEELEGEPEGNPESIPDSQGPTDAQSEPVSVEGPNDSADVSSRSPFNFSNP